MLQNKNSNDFNNENPEKKSSKNKNKKKNKKKMHPVKKFFAIIGTTLLSLVLIFVISGSIIAAALTVYVLQFVQKVQYK